MSIDGQGTKWRRNIAEIFNRLSWVHERYRRQTDDRRTGDSGREFTFAKKQKRLLTDQLTQTSQRRFSGRQALRITGSAATSCSCVHLRRILASCTLPGEPTSWTARPHVPQRHEGDFRPLSSHTAAGRSATG